MAAASDKDAGACRTIGEVADETGLAQHVLRYWETRFPQLRPLQRSGRRRYYRAEDVALAERIYHLLHVQGFTVEGARKALSEKNGAGASEAPPPEAMPVAVAQPRGIPVEALVALRQRLAAALR